MLRVDVYAAVPALPPASPCRETSLRKQYLGNIFALVYTFCVVANVSLAILCSFIIAVQGPAATFICDVIVRGDACVNTGYHSLHHHGCDCSV
jgi:hypothetical protein